MGWTGFTQQDLQRAINPRSLPWTPNTPLPPTAEQGGPPIAWAPPAGYNLTYSPDDKRPGVRHQQLRSLADSCDVMRVVIEDLKRQMLAQKWEVVPKDSTLSTHPRLEEVKLLLKRPDGDWSFSSWLGAVLEDIIVIGAAALGKLKTRDGRPAGLRVVDAATIAPIVTTAGTLPIPPFPAYYQHLYGQPYKEYTRDELIYRPAVRRSWTPYGYGPVEQTLRLVLLAIHRPIYYVRWYTDSNIPPAFVQMPEGWSEAKTGKMQEYLDALMSGNTPQKHKAIVVPYGTTVTPSRDEMQWQYEFDEFISRIFSWAIGVSPVYVVKNNTLGQGTQGLTQASEISGLASYARLVEEVLDDYIEEDLDCPGLTFSWVKEEVSDPAYKLQEDDTLLKTGAKTLNEVRKDRGLEPYDADKHPTADEPMVLTGAGYIPLKPEEPKPAAPPPQPGGQQPPPQQGQPPPQQDEGEEQVYMADSFDESEHPRGKTGPGTNEGSFAPKGVLGTRLAGMIRSGGGFTFQPATGEVPKEGYVVAAYLENELIVDDKLDDEKLGEVAEKYAEEHADLLKSDSSVFLGAWWDHDSGKIVFDTPVVLSDRVAALALGERSLQDSIWDLGRGETVPVLKGAVGERAKKADGCAADEEHDPEGVREGSGGDAEEGEGDGREGAEEAVKADLDRWRRKAMKDAKAGKPFRPFESDVIPAAMKADIEAALAQADVVAEEVVRRAFEESDHPRHPAGSSKGGEFASKDGVTSAKTRAADAAAARDIEYARKRFVYHPDIHNMADLKERAKEHSQHPATKGMIVIAGADFGEAWTSVHPRVTAHTPSDTKIGGYFIGGIFKEFTAAQLLKNQQLAYSADKADDAEKAEKPISGRITGQPGMSDLLEEGLEIWEDIVGEVLDGLRAQVPKADGDWDEQAHPRGESGPKTNAGSFVDKDGVPAASSGAAPLAGRSVDEDFISAEYKARIIETMKALGISDEDIRAEMDKLFKLGKEEDAAWYTKEYKATAELIAKRTGMDIVRAHALISAVSPNREWDSNKEVAMRIADVVAANSDVKIGALMARRLNKWYGGTLKSGAPKAPGWVHIEAGTYKVSDLHPAALARLVKKENGSAMASSSYQGVIDGFAIAKGADWGEVLNGPKTRSFFNNGMFPKDHRYATIDTWQLRAMFNNLSITYHGKTRTGAEWDSDRIYNVTAAKAKQFNDHMAALGRSERVQAGTYNSGKVEISEAIMLTSKQPKNAGMLAKIAFASVSRTKLKDDVEHIGLYPHLAGIIRRAAADSNLITNEYQARVWSVIVRQAKANAAAKRAAGRKAKQEMRRRYGM